MAYARSSAEHADRVAAVRCEIARFVALLFAIVFSFCRGRSA
jgi:hypothetical protein